MSLLRSIGDHLFPASSAAAPEPPAPAFAVREKILMQNQAIGLHEFFKSKSEKYRTIATAIATAIFTRQDWKPDAHDQDLPLCDMDITLLKLNGSFSLAFHISPLPGTKGWMKTFDNTEYHPDLVRSILLYVYPATLRKTKCHLICSICDTGVQKLCNFAPINPVKKDTLVSAYTSSLYSDRKALFHSFFPNFLVLLKKVLDKDNSYTF